jgi:hypothetical protein
MSSQSAITAATAAGCIQITDVKPDGGAAVSGNVKPPSTPRSAGSAAGPPCTPSTQPRVSAPPSHLTSKDFKPPSPKSQSAESVSGGGAAASTKKDFKAEDLRDSSASSKWVREHDGNQKLMEHPPGEFLKYDDERKEWVKIGEQEYRESFKVGRHKVDLQTAAMLLNKMPGPTPSDRYIKDLMELYNEGGTNIRQGTNAQNLTGTAAQKAANQEKGDRTAEMKFHRIMDGSLPDEDVKWTDNDSAKLQQYRSFLEQSKGDPRMTEALRRRLCDFVKRLERIEKMSSSSSKALAAAAAEAAAAKVVAEAKIAHDAKVKAEAEATKAKALATAAAEAKAKADAKAKAASEAAAAKAVADAKIARDAKVKAEAEATKAKYKALADAKALSEAKAKAASARYIPTYTPVSHASNYTCSSPRDSYAYSRSTTSSSRSSGGHSPRYGSTVLLNGSAVYRGEGGSSSGGDWGDSSGGYGGGYSSSSDHRCNDGSRDMRFSDNWGFDKYS